LILDPKTTLQSPRSSITSTNGVPAVISFIVRASAGAIPLLLFISDRYLRHDVARAGRPGGRARPRGQGSRGSRVRNHAAYGLGQTVVRAVFLLAQGTAAARSLGRSFVDSRPVVEKVFEKLPVTIEMVGLACC